MTEELKDEMWPRGRSIVGVRAITTEELEAEGWGVRWGMHCSVLILDDGSLIYPSCDPEGNDSGTLFGRLATGTTVTI